MYQLMAIGYPQPDWKFMNYGYTPQDVSQKLSLKSEDEINRTCIQLYHHVANAVELDGRKVLEVGSGRGGGADYIKRYLRPASMVGVDFSNKAVNLCRQHYSIEGLSFEQSDAERLHFNDRSFDVVVNIESSHCYGSMDDFLSQVKRVLKPGGHFLFTDFRDCEKLDELDKQLDRTAMRRIKQENITPNVINALDADHDRRMAHIQRGIPKVFRQLMREFAGNKGTWIYNGFMDGSIVYQNFVFQKI
jgi:ubiquinone/menaquinone biosynthesis C-methylase UbiE